MRLIDADAFEIVTAQNVSDDFLEGTQYVLEMIDNAPTIEAEPLIFTDWYSYDGIPYCSECDNPLNPYIYSWCPFCGSRIIHKKVCVNEIN